MLIRLRGETLGANTSSRRYHRNLSKTDRQIQTQEDLDEDGEVTRPVLILQYKNYEGCTLNL